MNKRSRKYKSKLYISKKISKKKLTRKNRRGGFLFDTNFDIGGINFSKQTGEKRYNWKTGKWDPVDCYGVGPLSWCKIKDSSIKTDIK